MAWRLKLVPDNTNIDFFAIQWLTFGASVVAVIGSLILWATVGLNFGIDFRGGTTIRTESDEAGGCRRPTARRWRPSGFATWR